MRITVKGFDYHDPSAIKLSRLEDFEEDHHIDLFVSLKALENGVWFRNGGRDGKNIEFIEEVCLDKDGLYHYEQDMFDDIVDLKFPLEEYGEWWALTREELEKTQRRK